MASKQTAFRFPLKTRVQLKALAKMRKQSENKTAIWAIDVAWKWENAGRKELVND